jgi:hypothetical protein
LAIVSSTEAKEKRPAGGCGAFLFTQDGARIDKTPVTSRASSSTNPSRHLLASAKAVSLAIK